MLTDLTSVDKYIKFFYEQLNSHDEIPEELKADYRERDQLDVFGIEKVIKFSDAIFYILKSDWENRDVSTYYQLGMLANANGLFHMHIQDKISSHFSGELMEREMGFDLYQGFDGAGSEILVAVLSKPRFSECGGFQEGSFVGEAMVAACRKYGVDKFFALYDDKDKPLGRSIAVDQATKIWDCYEKRYLKE